MANMRPLQGNSKMALEVWDKERLVKHISGVSGSSKFEKQKNSCQMNHVLALFLCENEIIHRNI